MNLFGPGPRFNLPAEALAQADGDWIRNSVPLGLKSPSMMAVAIIRGPCPKGQKPFYLAVSPRQIKNTPLRPSRLCGENYILDKNERE